MGVIGLGYVGLPLALAFAEQGFPVLGFDVDPHKIAQLSDGQCYIRHMDGTRVAAAVRGGRLVATADFRRLAEAAAILICVPTPLSAQRDPDLSFVEQTAHDVGANLRRGQLVVLESTTYPGTTDEVLRPILERTGLRSGQDFFLAFSPEREDPGNPQYATTTIPKLVGGADPTSGDLAEWLYAQVITKVIRVSGAAVAEAAKLTENIFRAVNIALVNELKVVYGQMGVDVWEVLDAAATKPFGFMRFNPGPGWGGHCIPLDPYYLSWKAREYGLDARFIELAGQINRAMPLYVVRQLQDGLNRQKRALAGSRVLILGLAYKKDVGDTRESPAFPIIQQLLSAGAEVSYHDPLLATVPKTRSWPGHPDMRSLPLTSEVLRTQDAVVIVTDHSTVDYEQVLRHAPLIVDTRGVYRTPHPRVIRA